MLPLVGCESDRSLVLWRSITCLVAVEHEQELLAHLVVAAARRHQVLAAGELRGLAEAPGSRRAAYSLSKALPTVGLAPQPEVVSDSPHLVETHRSLSGHSSRRSSDAHCTYSLAAFEARMMVSWSPCSSMPKPATGLPVLAMPSTTFFVQLVLDADHDDGGDVRVRAGADQRAEVQVEVGAELQPPVGMRNRQRALDVVRHRLGGGVRQVVHRQDDDVVAHADAAVLAPVAPECRFAQIHGFPLPALGLDVLDVGVLAHLDRRDDAADVHAVLDDGVVLARAP